MNNTYFVLGSGRCGSSTVARILHTKLSVFMGEHFRLPDRDNLKGYYEDLEFKNPNGLFLTGRYLFSQWNNIIKREIEKRQNKSWGLKDPRLCYLLGLYLCYINNPIFIRCQRNIEKVANSMRKCYGWKIEDSIKEVQRRELYLNRLLKNKKVLNISFDSFKTDEEIIIELEDQI